MKIISENSLYDFHAWSGAKDTLCELNGDQCDQIEWMLEDLYPDGMTDTELNDFLWFDKDTIAEWLGYEDWDDFMENKDND